MWHLKHSKNSRNLKQIRSRKGTLQSLIPFFYSQGARLPTGVKGRHWKGSVQFSAGARALHFPAPPLEKDVYSLFLLPTAQFFIHAQTDSLDSFQLLLQKKPFKHFRDYIGIFGEQLARLADPPSDLCFLCVLSHGVSESQKGMMKPGLKEGDFKATGVRSFALKC